MSLVKLGRATTRPLHKIGGMLMRLIVQRWERSPETSVNILLFAGSRMSVFRLGLSRSEYGRRPFGRPHRMIGNSPCRGHAPAVARDFFTGPCPGARLPESGLNCPRRALFRRKMQDRIDRLDARMPGLQRLSRALRAAQRVYPLTAVAAQAACCASDQCGPASSCPSGQPKRKPLYGP